MDIHKRLQGKTIAEVLHNGMVLNIRTKEGDDLMIAWVDENGKPLKGRPVVAQSGVRIKVASLHELANLPGAGVRN